MRGTAGYGYARHINSRDTTSMQIRENQSHRQTLIKSISMLLLLSIAVPLHLFGLGSAAATGPVAAAAERSAPNQHDAGQIIRPNRPGLFYELHPVAESGQNGLDRYRAPLFRSTPSAMLAFASTTAHSDRLFVGDGLSELAILTPGLTATAATSVEMGLQINNDDQVAAVRDVLCHRSRSRGCGAGMLAPTTRTRAGCRP